MRGKTRGGVDAPARRMRVVALAVAAGHQHPGQPAVPAAVGPGVNGAVSSIDCVLERRAWSAGTSSVPTWVSDVVMLLSVEE